MHEHSDHSFRLPDPPREAIAEIETRFRAQCTKGFAQRAEYYRHRHVIEDAMHTRLFGPEVFDERVQASMTALREGWEARLPVRDQPWPGPPVFRMKPGLNILAPPYDFVLKVGLGSNAASLQASAASGVFGVVGTAQSGAGTYGSTGVVLFVVPTDPARTLSIRPYFEWNYSFSCESHGSPTAHCWGSVHAEVSGNGGGGVQGFPGRAMELWRAGSDIWDDAGGADANVFRVTDSELVVSGFDYYTVNYICQAGADSHSAGFLGWSVAYFRLHCRVPFIVVEQF